MGRKRKIWETPNGDFLSLNEATNVTKINKFAINKKCRKGADVGWGFKIKKVKKKEKYAFN